MGSKDFREVLSNLKNEMKKSEILEATKRNEYIKCTEQCKDASPELFSAEENYNISISIYRSASQYQSNKEFKMANDALIDALRFTSDKTLTFLIKEKLKLIRQTTSEGNRTDIEKKILTICAQIDPESSPFDIIKNINPDLFTKPVAPFIPIHFDSFHSLGVYRWRGDFNASERFSVLLRQFKLGSDVFVDFMSFLAGQFYLQNPHLLYSIDGVVPVPADPYRESQRGYDLASSLAKTISKKLAVPLLDILKRKPNSRQSKSCSLSELKTQFSTRDKTISKLKSINILIVDDIVTQGNTITVCAELLKELGAGKLHCFCLAKSESTKTTLKYL